MHEARGEAVEVMGVRRLVELGVLLMRGERPPEVRGALHAERGLPLAPAPRGLLMLVVPRSLKLVVPGGVWLTVPGGFTLTVPPGLPLLTPHPFVVAVPGGAVGRALVVGEGRLIRGLQDTEAEVSHEEHSGLLNEEGGGGRKPHLHLYRAKKLSPPHTRCSVPAAVPKGQQGGAVQTRAAYLEGRAHEAQAHEAQEVLQDPGPQPLQLRSQWSLRAGGEPSPHLEGRQKEGGGDMTDSIPGK